MTIQAALEAAMSEAPEGQGGSRIDVDKAVNNIFARTGKKFAFVFNQNLRRTNVQVAELISLVHVHAYDGSGQPIGSNLEFMTFDEVKELLLDISQNVDLNSKMGFQRFSDEIARFCENKVLIEIYYGTASVFLPHNIFVRLDLICAESGYIHSCGDLLYLRNAEKATLGQFTEAIEEGLSLARSADDRFMLVPYCHEDFSGQDRSTPFIQHGLDDIKLHISKAFVGGKRLYDVIDEIAEANKNVVTIAPTNFKTSSEHFDEVFPGKNLNSIWVLSDADADADNRFPGTRKFYVIYLQRYKNNNFYHLYDENKPGWASHTTLPHSLAGAMINLCRPWSRFREISIADPFGGSGTIFFESQKLPSVTCVTSDIAPICRYTVEDNTKFFQLPRKGLESLRKELEAFTEAVPDNFETEGKGRKRETSDRRLGRILEVVRAWSQASPGDFLGLASDQLKEGFGKVGERLSDRLLLYVALRASVRGLTDFQRGTQSWLAFFRRELDQLLDQIGRHEDWITETSGAHVDNAHMDIGMATYSLATTPQAPEIGRHDLFEQLDFQTHDMSLLAKGKFDAIVTDPPYGFNTDENYWEFADFVRKMLPALVEALKPEGGQLLLAAPEISFSGRGIIPFVRARYLSREIIRYCAGHGRECVTPAVVLPTGLKTLRPPYYWVAEKTLLRKILHFWIRAVPLP